MPFLFLILIALLDVYAASVLQSVPRTLPWSKWIWWASTVLVWTSIAFLMFWVRKNGRTDAMHMVGWVITASILIYIPKTLITLPLLFEDMMRVIQWLARAVQGGENGFPERRRFIGQLALALAAIPLGAIIHGVWKGRYRYRVLHKELFFPDLPEAFDGYRIVQISDLHTGSFDDREKVGYGLDLVNSLSPDALLFTGDMVNNKASELDGWEDLYTDLSARDLKLSVLGNHDYGDYVAWSSEQEKANNLDDLKNRQRRMGFDLLLNEHRTIEREGSRIHIVGVENWGKPPFPQHGDLDKATKGIPKDDFTLLMSHDPSHFDLEVKGYDKHIALTLSGHTHGMQFGIEIPGWIKWSPVRLRYPKWAGLYEENNKRLYVNRGFGYLAFYGRVGIWPEITQFTLRSGKKA